MRQILILTNTTVQGILSLEYLQHPHCFDCSIWCVALCFFNQDGDVQELEWCCAALPLEQQLHGRDGWHRHGTVCNFYSVLQCVAILIPITWLSSLATSCSSVCIRRLLEYLHSMYTKSEHFEEYLSNKFSKQKWILGVVPGKRFSNAASVPEMLWIDAHRSLFLPAHTGFSSFFLPRCTSK